MSRHRYLTLLILASDKLYLFSSFWLVLLTNSERSDLSTRPKDSYYAFLVVCLFFYLAYKLEVSVMQVLTLIIVFLSKPHTLILYLLRRLFVSLSAKKRWNSHALRRAIVLGWGESYFLKLMEIHFQYQVVELSQADLHARPTSNWFQPKKWGLNMLDW